MSGPEKFTINKWINASRENVFDQWIRPENMEMWMSPPPWKAEVSLDPIVGGRLSVIMTHGDIRVAHQGTVLEVARPNRFAFTWKSVLSEERAASVVVEFTTANGGTNIRLTHTLLSSVEAAEEVSAETRRNWLSLLDHLGRQIDAKEAGRTKEA